MRQRKNVFLAKLGILVFGLGVLACCSVTLLWAQQPPTADDKDMVDSLYIDEIYLLQGELATIKVYSLTRLSLENPSVVDIVKADDKQILLIAKGVGKTALFLWDEKGKRAITIQVLEQDLRLLKQRIDKLLDAAGIKSVKTEINEGEGKVLLTGDVDKENKDAYASVLKLLNNKAYLDLTKAEENRDLIEIDMLITELNATLIQSLGISWNTGSSTGTSGTTGTSASGSTFSIPYAETLPADVSGKNMFKIGDFARTSAFTATINAYIQEGKARVISKPKLVVKNKEKAKINVGGQYPMKTTTTNNGVSSETITYKDYGVILDVEPEIINDKIEVTMKAEISDVDSSISTNSGAAFTTTSAETKVYLEDQQTIVIAGLIKKSDSDTITRVPFVSKIPIVGALFRTRSRPNTDKELVMTLKPTILSDYQNRRGQMSPGSTDSSGAGRVDLNSAAQAIPESMAAYVKNVQQKIANAVRYPPEAKDYGWSGTVKVGLLINRDGSLAYALINETSGYDIFDNDAIDTVKRLAPFDAFPPEVDLTDLNVIIPIAYNQTNK